MAEKEIPNTRPVARVFKELRGLHEGDARSDNYAYKRLEGTMKDGVRVITYSLNAPPKAIHFDHGADILFSAGTQLWKTDEENAESRKEAIQQAFAELETCVNVKFEEVDGQDADITFFLAGSLNPDIGAYAETIGKKRFTVVRGGSFAEHVAHEIGHTLGLSHPDHASEVVKQGVEAYATGNSPAYNKDGSAMAYPAGLIEGAGRHFGPYDIAVLQLLYGPAKNPNPHQFVEASNLPALIYSKAPVTLGIHTPPKHDTFILPPADDTIVRAIHDKRLAVGTDIAHIISSNTITKPLNFVGNKIPNVMKGGSGDDHLVTQGNYDVLTGGNGSDHFHISLESMDNVIVDFNPREDYVHLPIQQARTQMKAKIIASYNGKDIAESRIVLKDHDGKDTCSVRVLGRPPAAIFRRLTPEGGLALPCEVDIVDMGSETTVEPQTIFPLASTPANLPNMPSQPMLQRSKLR